MKTKDYGEKEEAHKTKEENERLRGEIKGADRAEGQNKMHEGGNKM